MADLVQRWRGWPLWLLRGRRSPIKWGPTLHIQSGRSAMAAVPDESAILRRKSNKSFFLPSLDPPELPQSHSHCKAHFCRKQKGCSGKHLWCTIFLKYNGNSRAVRLKGTRDSQRVRFPPDRFRLVPVPAWPNLAHICCRWSDT